MSLYSCEPVLISLSNRQICIHDLAAYSFSSLLHVKYWRNQTFPQCLAPACFLFASICFVSVCPASFHCYFSPKYRVWWLSKCTSILATGGLIPTMSNPYNTLIFPGAITYLHSLKCPILLYHQLPNSPITSAVPWSCPMPSVLKLLNTSYLWYPYLCIWKTYKHSG